MKKIGIVVLNFKTPSDTVECVNSLLVQTYRNFFVVIVENGSMDNSFEILSELFGTINNIHIIKSESNLGFARGNNLGIRYLREKEKCDYVFVVNNDVVTNCKLFEQILKVNISGIGVISPTLHYVNGTYHVPAVNTNNLTKWILKTYKSIFSLALLYYSKVFKILNIYHKLKPKGIDNTYSNTNRELLNMNNSFAIQGPAFFLTPNFFNYYNQLFPNTFLYWEEIDLLWYLKKVDLKAIIVTTDPVIHKEKQATKELIGREDWDRKQLALTTKSMVVSTPLFFMSYKKIRKKYSYQ